MSLFKIIFITVISSLNPTKTSAINLENVNGRADSGIVFNLQTDKKIDHIDGGVSFPIGRVCCLEFIDIISLSANNSCRCGIQTINPLKFLINFIPNYRICFFDFISDAIYIGSNISNSQNKHTTTIFSKSAAIQGNDRSGGVSIRHCFNKFCIKQILERTNFIVETSRTTKSILSNICDRKVCASITGDTSESNKKRINLNNFTVKEECGILEISDICPAINTNSNRPIPENTDSSGGISWFYHNYKNNQYIQQVRIKRVDRSGADILFSDGTFIIDADTVCIDVFVRGIWYHLIGPNIYDLPEF